MQEKAVDGKQNEGLDWEARQDVILTKMHTR